jgi:hypothetical protein
MLADRALRAAFSNFSTLFLLAATILFPLHLARGYIFRDVYEVRDIHATIEEFPNNIRKINRVSRGDLERSRGAGRVVLVAEIVLLPLLAAAALRAVRTQQEGGVPTALGSWRGIRDVMRLPAAAARFGVVLIGAVVAIAVGWLAFTTGLILVEPVPDSWAWLAVPGVEAISLALAAPFLLAAIAQAALAVPHVRRSHSSDRMR